MNFHIAALLPLALIGWLSSSITKPGIHLSSNVPELIEPLKPTAQQLKAQALSVDLLTKLHYRKVPLSDSISGAIFERYINSMDPSHFYFLDSDIEEFKKSKLLFDDFLKNNQLDVPFLMYDTFRERYQERSDAIEKILNDPKTFDFSVNESIELDREKAPWPKNQAEMNDLWRKMVKSQALDLKLDGKADTAIANTLRQRYKTRNRALERIRSDQVFQIYINAYAQSLDPHTLYMSPSNADRFKVEMSQSLEGIGAQLQEDGNYIKIVDILPGGPAFKSKYFKKNDRIVGVAQGDDGKIVDIVGWFVDDAIKLIKGSKGTIVRLQILPAGASPNTHPTEYRLVRDKINLEAGRAKKQTIEVSANSRNYKIGVIEIPSFYRDFEGVQNRDKDYSSTTRDVQKLIGELQQENIDGLVIDLRDDGGGSLIEAISLTGLFIKEGPVVQVRNNDNSVEVQNDRDPALAYDGPLAVMVNRFSASASEIFAAAIQDYQRGVIIGEKSFGKGTVQTLIDLNQMSRDDQPLGQMKMTIAKFYRINGSSTQRKGVTPFIEMPSAFGEDEFSESSESSALPWDKIEATKFSTSGFVSDAVLTTLVEKHKLRMSADSDLKKLEENFAALKKERENSVESLLESTRKAERAEATKKSKELLALEKSMGNSNEVSRISEEPISEEDSTGNQKLAKTRQDSTQSKKLNGNDSKKVTDVFLSESGRVLADLVEITKEGELANTRKEQP